MRQSSQVEVFRGHWEECLKHLDTRISSKAPKGLRGAEQARKPLADFCGVKTPTVTRWFSGVVLPRGTELIRLLCYMDLMGYKVIELERMKAGRRGFAELVGFGLLSIEQAAELLGYVNTMTLYQVLHGYQNPDKEKDQKMWDTWKERSQELELRKEEARKRNDLDTLPKVDQVAEKSSPMLATSGKIPRHTAAIIVAVGLRSLLEDDLFEDFSENDCAELRQTADRLLVLLMKFSGLGSWLATLPGKGGSDGR